MPAFSFERSGQAAKLSGFTGAIQTFEGDEISARHILQLIPDGLGAISPSDGPAPAGWNFRAKHCMRGRAPGLAIRRQSALQAVFRGDDLSFEQGCVGLPRNTCGRDDNDKLSLRALVERWASGDVVVMHAICVEELRTAGPENLETIMEVCAWREVFRTKAGAGVIDFNELHRLVSAVVYCGSYIGRMASAGCKQGTKQRKP